MEDGSLVADIGHDAVEVEVDAAAAGELALRRVRVAALVTNLSNLAFGYDVGVMSGALLYLRKPDQLDLGEVEVEVVAALFNVAAALGALCVAGALSEAKGRRAALLVANALLFCGFAYQALARSFWHLALGRALAGAGSGLSWVAASALLAELAPTSERGVLTAVADLAINIGIPLGYGASLAVIGVAPDDGARWRGMLALGALLPVALVALRGRVPESPRWLLARGRDAEARAILEAYHVQAGPSDTVDAFVARAKRAADRGAAVAAAARPPSAGARSRQGFYVAAAGQANGSEGVLYFVGTVLRDGLGLRRTVPVLLASLGVGLVKLLGVIVAMAVVERAGRRPMLTLSGSALAATLAALAATVAAGGPVGVVVLLLCLYMFSFSLGAGSFAIVVFFSRVFNRARRGVNGARRSPRSSSRRTGAVSSSRARSF